MGHSAVAWWFREAIRPLDGRIAASAPAWRTNAQRGLDREAGRCRTFPSTALWWPGFADLRGLRIAVRWRISDTIDVGSIPRNRPTAFLVPSRRPASARGRSAM